MYIVLIYTLHVTNTTTYSTKNTILKKYDGRFRDIFAEIFAALVLLLDIELYFIKSLKNG